MDGYTRTQATVYMWSVTSWMHSRCTALYHLAAGTTYLARAMWISSPSGFNQQIWNGPTYFAISGHVIADGRV
jgi:hypothetical protein